MPRASLSTQDPAVIDLETVTTALLELCKAESLDLVALGKTVEQRVRSANNVVEASGRSSARFEAASRALDLTTPKSSLNLFLDSLDSEDAL